MTTCTCPGPDLLQLTLASELPTMGHVLSDHGAGAAVPMATGLPRDVHGYMGTVEGTSPTSSSFFGAMWVVRC